MSGVCDSGQLMKSRGLERQAGNAVIAYVRDALGCDHKTALAPAPAMEGYLEGTHGSANHRLLLRAWRAAAAWRAKLHDQSPENVEEADAATHWLEEWFTRENTIDGWMYGEVLSTNHDQLYELGLYGARILALWYKNTAILEATAKHLRQARWMYDALNLDNHVVGPCSRCSVTGKTSEQKAASMAACDIRTVCYSLMAGHPAPQRLLLAKRHIAGDPNDPNGRFWQDTYNVGAAYARELIRRADDLGGAMMTGEQPRLRDELVIQRKGDDMIASFAHLTKAGPNVCFWAGRKGRKIVSAPFHKGTVENLDCPYEIPKLVNPEITVIPGI